KTKVSRLFLKYNNENRPEILKKAEDLNSVLSPGNFAQNARELSQDDKASAGGDWGYWEWKNFSSQEQEFIKKMSENQISTPIDTRQGFSIIFISEKIAQQQESFETTKTRIKDVLERDKTYNLVREKLDKIHRKLNPKESLKDQAQELGFKYEETGLLASGEILKGIDETGNVSKKFFTLQKGKIGFPVELRQGMAIVQLSAIIEPGIEAFENIKTNVIDAYVNDRKMNLLMQDAIKLITELKAMHNEKTISRFLKKKNLNVDNLAYKRSNKLSHLPVKKGLDEIIFSLKENQYALPIQYDSEIAIIKLKTKKIVDKNEFENDRTSFYQTQIEKLKNNYFGTYIMKKRGNAEIKFNQELFGKIRDYVMSRY
ncbi:MAG: peptidylprolyl isomerase, partial [Candidatus Aminicenantes bacterium]|nr:peptidylprolyl isomerase [Candidatus Aminicenantes bacterium]